MGFVPLMFFVAWSPFRGNGTWASDLGSEKYFANREK
jgi:hypothetical protein